MDKFSKKIQVLMNELGVTCADVSRNTRITESALSRYVSGERTPRIDILLKLASYFSVTIDDLINDAISIDNLPNLREMVFRNAKRLSDCDKEKIIEEVQKELHGR